MASLQESGVGGTGEERQRGQGQGRGRGRGRGRGERGGPQFSNTEVRRGRGGRGGAGRGGANALSAGDLSARFAGKSEQGGNEGTLAGSQSKKAAEGEGDGEKTEGKGDTETEAEVCWICASPIVHEAIAPCNHRTCHICSLRMRALYKDKNCAHCRVCLSAPCILRVVLTEYRHQHHTLSSRIILRKGMRISRPAISRARTRISGSGMKAMISERILFCC